MAATTDRGAELGSRSAGRRTPERLATETKAAPKTTEFMAFVAIVAGILLSALLIKGGDSEGGMFGFFLMDALPQNYATVMTTDNARFNALFHGLLDRGVYIAPALYEAGFVSSAHTEADIAETVAAAREIFRTLG